jgi:NitT/TauT family transport system substrate-binding protein
MTNQRPGRVLRAAAVLFTFAIAAAACGGDDDSSDDTTAPTDPPAATDAPDTETTDAPDTETTDAPDTETTDAPDVTEAPPATDAPAELEQTELKLGLIPIADVAPVFIGNDRGIFEKYGLTVTTEFAAGGALAIPSVISGDIDLAFGAYPSALSAIEAGLPLLVATEAVRSGPLFAGLYSMPDSGIETPADMAGKTVAVNTLNNVVQIAVEAHLVDAGLTLDDITLVEIGFPDMVAALETGNVDVISVVEPFGTIARNTLDAHLIVDMFSARLENFPVAGYFVTEEWAAANPNTLAAFNAAFAEATAIANDEEGALAQIVTTYTSASPEAAAALNYPNMVAGVDAEYLQIVSDFMTEQGLLAEPINIGDYVIADAPASSVTG